MGSTVQNNDTGNNLSTKWIYVIIVVLALGFGTYGYFKVKKWVHYAAVERYEKPITDYTITKVYSEIDKYQTKRKGVNDDDVDEKEPDYYMEVSYKGKDYKLEIEEFTYTNYNKSGKVTLYYDAEGDEVFVAGTGGANLLVAALAAVALLIVIIVMVIWFLFKSMKKKQLKKAAYRKS
ncbi:MAG: hypothetical protein J5637_08655 [Prevotella sp.]|nr:hypothetical protein [Prevotella sp.]